MRRRSTFIVEPNADFEPSDIQLKASQLLYPGLKAAREEKLTFGFDELPPQLLDVLRQLHELHIRWAPEKPYNFILPYLSRLTPGLHVHYTPLKQISNDLLCGVLRAAFAHDLKCSSPEASFTRPDVLSDRFASSASWQYYSTLPLLTQFVAYIQRNICSQSDQQCLYDAALLNIVDSLDLDYDSISHTLSLTAFWSKPPPAVFDPIGQLTTFDRWPIDISSTKNGKVEVGILSASPATEPYELQLGGFLAVVGEDEEAKPTMFSFPSRYQMLSATQRSAQEYKVSFQQPTGLHPIMEISFKSRASLRPPENRPSESTCALHTYMTLPSSIFADQYAFTANDPLFEQSHNLRSLRSISGELDLEAPDYVVQKWGSALLLELASPAEDAAVDGDSPWNVTIPLHLRYQPPSAGGVDSVRIPWPLVFWACTAEEGTKFPVNPFDRVNLGYDGIFGPRTMFYHLRPMPPVENERKLIETIKVPVLDTTRVGGDGIVEQVTLVTILLGFGWIVLKLWPGLKAQFGNTAPSTKRGAKVQKKRQ